MKPLFWSAALMEKLEPLGKVNVRQIHDGQWAASIPYVNVKDHADSAILRGGVQFRPTRVQAIEALYLYLSNAAVVVVDPYSEDRREYSWNGSEFELRTKGDDHMTERTYTTAELLQVLQPGMRARMLNTDNCVLVKPNRSVVWEHNEMCVELCWQIVNARWRILPQYVDFMTAFKAWDKDGKWIRWEKGPQRFSPQHPATFTPGMIRSDEWIIEEGDE